MGSRRSPRSAPVVEVGRVLRQNPEADKKGRPGDDGDDRRFVGHEHSERRLLSPA